MLGLESNLGYRRLFALGSLRLSLHRGFARSFEAQHCIHSLRRAKVRNWVSLMEGVEGTCGLLTTNSSKEVMCVAVQQLLANDRLHISQKLLSVSLPPRETLDQLIQEMRSFMIFVDPPKTLFAKVRPPVPFVAFGVLRCPHSVFFVVRTATPHVHWQGGRT